MESRNKLTRCRLCLSVNECFINIFKWNDWQGYVAAEVISDLFQIQVSETDCYPHVVCSTCLTKLTDFKLFKECCQKSKVTYDNMFVSSEILEEIKTEMDIGEGGSGLESCLQDPLKEKASDPIIKPEELDIDSSVNGSDEPLEETNAEASFGPISLKDELLSFNGNSQTQEELIDSEVSENQGIFESTTAFMHDSPQDNKDSLNLEPEEEDIDSTEDISIGMEVENKMQKMENDIGGDGDAWRGTGPEKGGRKRRERLECFHCGIVLKSKPSLIRHMKVHGFVNSYDCAECGKAFRFNSQLKIHLLVHTGFKPYKCTECSKTFSKSSHFKTHMRLHTGSKPYKCAECSKSFNQNSDLKKHMRIHTGFKPYKCAECSKSFTVSSTLNSHMRSHTGSKPYKCAECSKCFAHNVTLKRHMSSHTGSKPYKCVECSKGFIQSSALIIHIRTHTGSKPYKCTVCSKSFSHSSALKTHSRIHTGLKLYKCAECSKCFSYSSSLNKHMVLHTGAKLYKCAECSKCFSQNSHLKIHMRLHSGSKQF